MRSTCCLFYTSNVGGSFEDHYTRSIDVGGKLMTVPNLFSLANVEPASGKRDQGYLRTRNVAFFASAELGWKNMLYLSATGRCDWASQLVSNCLLYTSCLITFTQKSRFTQLFQIKSINQYLYTDY